MNSYRGHKPYLFTSYDINDQELVQPVLDEMIKKGSRIYIQAYGSSDDPPLQAKHRRIRQASAVLILMTGANAQSVPCFHNWVYARKVRKRIYVLRLERSPYSPVAQELLKSAPSFDFTENSMLAMEKLFQHQHIRACVRKPTEWEDLNSCGTPQKRRKKQENLVEAYLCYLLKGKECERKLDTFPFTLGRASNCDLKLEDRRISGRHAQISEVNGEYYFEDLQSTNGSLVNGKVVMSGVKVKLSSGDRVYLCNQELLFVKKQP